MWPSNPASTTVFWITMPQRAGVLVLGLGGGEVRDVKPPADARLVTPRREDGGVLHGLDLERAGLEPLLRPGTLGGAPRRDK